MKPPVKMSEVLDQFAGGYFSRGESPEEMQELLNIAYTAWNIACLPEAEREAALATAASEFLRQNPGADDWDDFMHDLRRLIERKDALFPDQRRLVANARIIPIDETRFRIEAASVALDPPRAGAEPERISPPQGDPARRTAALSSSGSEENLDVLQNIEYAIISIHRLEPDLTDYAVMRALEALIDRYKGEKAGRPQRQWRPSETERRLEGLIHSFCELRLGRAEAPDGPPPEGEIPTLSVDALLRCLKKILKSVQFWNKEGGSRGYLDFVDRFIP
jgi:hypothetical protein